MAKTLQPPKWKEPPSGGLNAYRFVAVDSRDPEVLADFFKSELEEGHMPFGPREEAFPELMRGMSAYSTRDDAQREWDRIYGKYGEETTLDRYIAEVRLTPDQGFLYEDRGSRANPKGHLTLRGAPRDLAKAVIDIYPVRIPTD